MCYGMMQLNAQNSILKVMVDMDLLGMAMGTVCHYRISSHTT